VPNEHQWLVGDLSQRSEKQIRVVARAARDPRRSGSAKARQVERDRGHAPSSQFPGHDSKVLAAASPAVQPHHPGRAVAVRLSKEIRVTVAAQHLLRLVRLSLALGHVTTYR
jgi:hypothetical protein